EGWLVGEGAGAIVLKKTSEVKEDKVYATIDSVGKNLTVQNVGYHELANTGIDSEDNEELNNLTISSNSIPTALGSVKANIGHTYAASGIASLIKTALCLHHRFIPAIPNWKAAKDASKFQDNQFYFPSKSRPWILQNDISERRAIVNGLENIQVQMTEAVSETKHETTFLQKNIPNLFALKGNSEKEIQQQISALEIAIETATPISEVAQQFFTKSRDKQTDFCAVLIAKNKKDLNQEIKFFQKNITRAFENNQILKTPRGSYFSPNPLGKKGKVAFVYPGSSTAYTGLGKDLFQLFPQLYPHFEKTLPNLDEYIWSDYLFPKKINVADEDPNIYNNAIAMMSTGVFYSAAFTHILQEVFGVKPEMAFGYSMGECSSMWYALGVWSSNEAREFQDSPIFKNRFAGNLELLAETWGISSEEAKERWVSLVLLAPRAKVEELIKGKDKVYLTFVNTENEVVISGDKTTCLAIAKELDCQTVTIPFQNVIHHDFCKKEEEGLLKMHSFDLNKNLDIDFYSSITQEKIPLDDQLIAENSTAVCCNKVDFPKTVNTLLQKGANIFIELGANATCTGWINNILKEKEHLAVSINQKGKADAQAILEVLAQLVSNGIKADLSALYIEPKAGKVPRSFMKKIEVGGQRIFDLIEKEKEKGNFKNIKSSTPRGALVSANPRVSTPKKELAFADDGGSNNLPPKTESMDFIDKTIHLQNNKMDNLTIKNTSKISPSVNETAAVNSPLGVEGIGENGLRLQNFESGEQLEGKEIIFSQEDLEEFATGKIANVFGPEYAIIDTYSRRTMLPMDPYLLVSRVTGLKGEKGKFEPSTMQTEYDIPYGAWFTTDRQIPWAVSVESGQCDLLLISYLGIDFTNKGNLVYRLLDCTLTFMDDLPFEGQTLRYDISIDSFIKNGDNLLFFFSYQCYVEDRLVLKMDGGCAGYFEDKQLEDGNGVVYSDKELEVKKNAKKRYFTPLLNTPKTSFSKEDLHHLINGDMEKCFDDISYFANKRNPSLRLPPEKILMIDRITSVDLTGGAFGLGLIVAEKDLHPDDWYFPCHFRNDEVLAGSLQAEGGGNLLRFFMLMLGLQRLTKDARYQPIFDLPQKVRCRKEVKPSKDTKLVYKLEIKEIGLIPNPYVIGDLEIISDGVVTVHFENLGLQLREKTNPKYLEEASGKEKAFYGTQVSPRSEGALMNELDITTFALDDLSKCFGEDFAVYDGRKVSRQPNTDLQVISRIISVDGTRKDFSKPSKIHAEYDVPVNAWYYEQNSAATMPYSILMEIALQPCGLLGAYLGSTLQFADTDLYFRNLDGNGEMFDLPAGTDFRGKTITNHAVLTSSVSLGGTILQNYTFECSIDGHVFYKGKSSFGFFPGEMLATQVGLDGGKNMDAWYVANNLQKSDYMQIKLDSLYGKMKLYKAPANKPHYRLAENQLNLIDNLIIAKDAGEHGKGYVHATKFVMPYEWFYTCHFYQDPVMPGSLGVEAILQAMQVFALQQDLGKDFSNPKFVQLPNHETSWKYRGQILTHVREMQLEVHIKSMEMKNGQLQVIGDASLWNDEVRIYQVTDLALGIEEA
ncbi:MAG: PfaB family protein, partial [Granulosicoccus sp.]